MRNGLRFLGAVLFAVASMTAAARATVTVTVKEQVVATGRFVRIGDIAGLEGEPAAVTRLARVVLTESPSGQDVIDLRRGDIERRLVELGMRRDVTVSGAVAVRIYAADGIDMKQIPARAAASATTIPATASALAPRRDEGIMAMAPAKRPDATEWLPGLADIAQTEWVANAQFLPASGPASSERRTEESRAYARPAVSVATLAAPVGSAAPDGYVPAASAGDRGAVAPTRNVGNAAKGAVDPNDFPVCVSYGDLIRMASPSGMAANERYSSGGPRPAATPAPAPVKSALTPDRLDNTDNGVVPAVPEQAVREAGSVRTGLTGAPAKMVYASDEWKGDLFDAYEPTHPAAKQTRLWHVDERKDASASGRAPTTAARPGGESTETASRDAAVQAIAAHLAESWAVVGGKPVVVVKRGAEGMDQQLTWRVASLLSGKMPGQGRFLLEATALDGKTVSARVEAETGIEVPVLMLRRVYVKDEPIKASDVYVERRLADPASGFLSDPAQLAGQAAARTIPIMKPLVVADLMKPLWVKKRDKVSVKARGGIYEVVFSGIALGDGRGGDKIVVQDSDRKNVKHIVQVTGPGEGIYVGREE